MLLLSQPNWLIEVNMTEEKPLATFYLLILFLSFGINHTYENLHSTTIILLNFLAFCNLFHFTKTSIAIRLNSKLISCVFSVLYTHAFIKRRSSMMPYIEICCMPWHNSDSGTHCPLH